MKRVIHTHGRHLKVKKPRIIHHHDKSGRWLGLLLLLLALGAVILAFLFGLNQGGYYQKLADREVQDLSRQLQEQQELVSGLRSESVRYKRQAEIERQASRELQQQLIEAQNQVADLKSEVELLQSLISNDSGSLYIKGMTVRPGAEPGRFEYSFTLVQVKEKIKKTQGKLLLKWIGRRKGKTVVLDRDEFAPDGKKTLKLGFANYLDVKGDMLLPEAFEPVALEVEFLPRNKGLKKMAKRYAWHDLVK